MSKERRMIVHMDLDCFYAQVEMVRLGIDANVPLGVQQWDNLIAVNYAARALGVDRHAGYKECFEKCPQLKLVHVPTYSLERPKDGLTHYKETTVKNTNPPSRNVHKASLQPYREASMKIVCLIRKILERMGEGCAGGGGSFVIEKASVDEVYIDLGELCRMNMQNESFKTDTPTGVPASRKNNRKEWADDDKDIDAEDSQEYQEFIVATNMIASIRASIFNELGYTISAGIAANKTVAKLASAANKPNNQTWVASWMLNDWMHQIPFHKIKSLGGKLGAAIQQIKDEDSLEGGEDGDGYGFDHEHGGEKQLDSSSAKVKMASDLWDLSLEQLEVSTGCTKEQSKYIYNILRGIDNDPVTPKTQTKTFMSAKQLRPPIRSEAVLKNWILLLVDELSHRLNEEYSMHSRWPSTITIHYRTEKDKTKSFPFPLEPSQLQSKLELFAGLCLDALKEETKRDRAIFPLYRIAISAGKFRIVYDDGLIPGTMDKFLVPKSQIKSTNPGIEQTALPKTILPKSSPKNSKKRTLLTFFTEKIEAIDAGDTIACDQCGKKIKVDMLDEHADFHFAMSLQEKENADN